MNTLTRFESIGAYLPEGTQSTSELMASMTHPQPIDLADITGIRSRRKASFEETTLKMASEAVSQCLAASKYQPQDIEAIISCSISRTVGTRDQMYFDPSISLLIKKKMGLTNALNFDVSNACSGFISGAHFLNNLIQAGVVKNGIVVSGEQISPIAETAAKEISEPFDSQFGSLTVGDSAVAVVIDNEGSAEDHIDYIELTTCAEYSRLCIGKPSDKNSGYALYTNNTEMHKNERLAMWPKFHSKLLEMRETSFSEENFDFIIQHQVGAKFVKKVNRMGEEIFGTPMPETLNVVEELGNTATTSHFVVLHQFLKSARNRQPNTKILMVPAASGLVTGAVSATFTNIGVA